MSNADMSKIAMHVDAIARAAGCGTSHPLARAGGYAGHVALHGTEVTHTSPVGVLRCLAALGVSRDPWRVVETASGTLRRANLRDVDGEQRGEVTMGDEGASATLWFALSRPMACFA